MITGATVKTSGHSQEKTTRKTLLLETSSLEEARVLQGLVGWDWLLGSAAIHTAFRKSGVQEMQMISLPVGSPGSRPPSA